MLLCSMIQSLHIRTAVEQFLDFQGYGQSDHAPWVNAPVKRSAYMQWRTKKDRSPRLCMVDKICQNWDVHLGDFLCGPIGENSYRSWVEPTDILERCRAILFRNDLRITDMATVMSIKPSSLINRLVARTIRLHELGIIAHHMRCSVREFLE